MKVIFVNTVEAGGAIHVDHGTDYSNPRDSVLNCLFMDTEHGELWIKMYKHALSLLGNPPIVARSLENFINDNVERVKAMTSEPPSLHMPPGPLPAPRPRCARCVQPMAATFVCARCKNAAYCSKICQADAWETHQRECAEITD